MSRSNMGEASDTATRSALPTHSRTEALMGGRTTVTVVGGHPDMLTTIFSLAHRCESLWSRFLPTSDLMRLNTAGGAPVEVDELTIQLIRSMIDGHTRTNGAFDPTLLPALLAAGYDRSTLHPARRTLLPLSATAPGDMAGIRVDGCAVRLPPGTTLDAGGIGKGFTGDLLCQTAMRDGAAGAMAQVSGDVVVAGQAPDGEAWRLGIENPFASTAASSPQHCDVVRLVEGALATSSVRKRTFQVDGIATHHLIDPTTIRSARTVVQTVSVIASTGAWAEVLTKPGFLVDPFEYLRWLPTVGAAGLLIDIDGRVLESTNWEHYR